MVTLSEFAAIRPPTQGGIQRNRPRNIQSLSNKLADPSYQQAVSRLPIEVQKAIAAVDSRRIDRGGAPVPAEDAIRAGIAAATRRELTPSGERQGLTSIPTNAVRDLALITKSIPHLPKMFADEIRDFADGFEDNRRDEAARGRTGLAATLNMPGIRFIPGAYLASNILAGEPGEIVKHPLLHALDVLPWVSAGAARTPVVKAARSQQLINRAAGQPYARRVRPIATALTRRLDDQGNLTRTRLGRGVERAWQTKPLAAVSDSFGQTAREATRTLSMGEQTADARIMRPQADDAVGQAAAEWHRLMSDDKALADAYGMTRAREVEVSRIASRNPEQVGSLAPLEQKFIADASRAQDQLAKHIADTTGDLVQVGGEWFTRADGNRIRKAVEREAAKIAEVTGTGQTVRVRSGGKWVERVDRGLMGDIDRLALADPRWAAIREMIDAGDLRGAAKASKDLDIRDAARKVNQLKNYGHKAAAEPLTDQRMFMIRRKLNEAANAINTSQRLRKTTNPARFDELINSRAGDIYLRQLHDASVFPSLQEARRLFDQGTPDQIPGFNRKDWETVRRQVRNNWEGLRAQGLEPTFVARVTPERARMIGTGRLDASVPSLQTARKRVTDMSPSTNSLAVSVSNQAWDIIRRETAEQTVRELTGQFGISEARLFEEFTPAAEMLAEINPRYDVVSARNTLINRQYRKFDANKITGGSGVAGSMATDAVWVPRQVAAVIDAATSHGFSKTRALNDPLTRTWRVSLLALSPRWHLYNIVGGAMMMSAEVGPQALRHFGQAREIVNAAHAGKPMPRWVPRELERTIGLIGRDEAALALKQGVTLHRWLNEAGGFKRVAEQAKSKGRGFVQKSYDINSWFDDMYRVMAHLEGESQALKQFQRAGMSDDAARMLAAQEGMLSARKILQDVSAMTPFERSVLRPVFPFYSWLSHLMKFAFNYPLDHPWRTAILAEGSRLVLEDLGDGATLDMLDLVPWGGRDDEGRQQALRVGNMNPFGETADMFTLAGWMGSTNPLFQTALEALGFDSFQGGADLYPSISYSPLKGGMVVDSGNPVKNLTLNTLPHLGALVRVVGMDPEHERLRRLDPEAADRALLNSIGFPASYRRISREEELVQRELRRGDNRQTKVSEALRSGDFRALEPFLGPEAVAALQQARESGQLDPYLEPREPSRLAAAVGGRR